jgi:hypothetical protein
MHYIHELGQSCLNIFNPSEGPKILYNALSFLVHSLLFSFILNSIYLLFFPLPFHLLHPSLKTWKKEENKVLWPLSFLWPSNMQRTSILALKKHVIRVLCYIRADSFTHYGMRNPKRWNGVELWETKGTKEWRFVLVSWKGV